MRRRQRSQAARNGVCGCRCNINRVVQITELIFMLKEMLEYTSLEPLRPIVPDAMAPVLECMRIIHSAKCAEIVQKNECIQKIRQALDILAVGSPYLKDAVKDIYVKEFPIPHIPSDSELMDIFVNACHTSSLYTAAEPFEPVGVALDESPEIAPFPPQSSSVLGNLGLECSTRPSTASSMYAVHADKESQASNMS